MNTRNSGSFNINVVALEDGTDANIKPSEDWVGEWQNRKGNIAGSDILTPTAEQKLHDPSGLGGDKKISLLSEGIDKLKSEGYDQSTILYNVFLHEIGHNLGGSHADGGAMTPLNISSFDNTNHKSGSSPDFRNNTITFKAQLSVQNVRGIISTIWNTSDPERRGKIHLIKN